MKVLYFIESLRSGGKERQLIELLTGLSQYKKLVTELAVMSEDIHYKSVYDLNVKMHLLIRKNKKDPRIFLKFYMLCKKLKPDIIHSWGSMPSVYAVPIAAILNIKFINGMLRSAAPKTKLLEKNYIRAKLTFPFSDVIVANSMAGLKEFNAPLFKSICIYNGFDFSRINNIKSRKVMKGMLRLGNEKIVGMVASFSMRKDYKTYLSTAKMILKKRGDVTFLAIGDGEKLDKYKKMVGPEFNARIKFLGKQNDVESIINIFDIGILSTNTKIHNEGISNSIVEYMALGKPVVATTGGGTKEIVLDNETGFLVPANDPESLSQRIEMLLENKDLSDNMGKAGKKRVEEYFNLGKMTNAYLDLYEKIMMD